MASHSWRKDSLSEQLHFALINSPTGTDLIAYNGRFPSTILPKSAGMHNIRVYITSQSNIQKVNTTMVGLKTKFQIQTIVIGICNMTWDTKSPTISSHSKFKSSMYLPYHLMMPVQGLVREKINS